LSWYEQYCDFTDRDKDLFREAANLLFSKTFLVAEREDDRVFYRFVEKHMEVFRNYFLLSGWDLLHNKRLSVLQLYNRSERNRYDFNLMETILLFILRLLYDEKQKDLRLTRQVIITMRDIQEKYMALQIRSRLPAQEDLHKILKMFHRFSLIDLKRGHWKDMDAVFVLYPSLLLVLEAATVEELADWIAEKAAEVENAVEISEQNKAD